MALKLKAMIFMLFSGASVYFPTSKTRPNAITSRLTTITELPKENIYSGFVGGISQYLKMKIGREFCHHSLDIL